MDVLYIEKREQALEEESVERLRKADIVMFTGGDQLRLTSILGGTPFHNLLLEKYQNEDFIFEMIHFEEEKNIKSKNGK